MMFSSMRTGPASEIVIYGEAARLTLSLYRFDGLRLQPADRYPGDAASRLQGALDTLLRLPSALALRAGEFTTTFVGVWRHFLDCALDGTAPACVFADGRAAYRIARASSESARRRETVAVEEGKVAAAAGR
jgi:predicted dehydrogenase